MPPWSDRQSTCRRIRAILGGSKVSDKITVIDQLMERADALFIGGGMAYTFLKVQGTAIGNSLCEEEHLGTAENILKKGEETGVTIYLPLDHIVTDSFDSVDNIQTVTGDIPEGTLALDIGPLTLNAWVDGLDGAKTVIWNGPVGVFEKAPFVGGTRGLATKLAAMEDTITVIGGGDTAAAVRTFGLSDRMTHVSTGGGASLEFLEGKTLPGVAALESA
jgi:phosphoglycerate kinase